MKLYDQEALKKAREFFAHDAFATDVAGIEITAVGENYARVDLELDKRHYNAVGAVMGGVCFTMADFAFAVASNFNAPPCVTLSSQILYLSAAEGTRLTAEAVCLKNGRRTCFYEITVTDDTGAQIARVTTEGYRPTV